jgi:hypothetical protein
MKKILFFLSSLFLLTAPLAHAETLRRCTAIMDATGQAASTNGTLVEFQPFQVNHMSAVLTVVNASGTSPTIDAKIQSCRSADASTCYDWHVFDRCTTGTCKPAPVDFESNIVNWFRFFRVVTTLGGTSPVYSVKVELCYY